MMTGKEPDRLEISFKGLRALAVGPLAVGGLLVLVAVVLIAKGAGFL